jgi:predicted methyltransferase
MHRVKDVDPLSDASRKVSVVRVGPGHKVLDICTGLGYTAIMSCRRGAFVTTVEADEYVLWIAERNPWSSELTSSRIVIVLGDAFEVVDELPREHYDRIIHDPPRISESSGLLYSLDFYKKLFAVLRRGGILYHYTGESGRLRKVNLPGKVSSRLKRAGFEVLFYDKKSLGIVARKP